MKLSKKMIYFIAVVMAYLEGYAYTFNRTDVSGFATGIIVGFGLGIIYYEQKIKETKLELEHEQKKSKEEIITQ